MSGLRPHSTAAAELGPETRTLASPVPLALRGSPLNTHSSAFGSRESHHSSLTTGARGAWRSGASILTSGALGTEVTEAEVRTGGGWSEEGRGSSGERYLQWGQSCHQDQGCQGCQSDPTGEQRGVMGCGRGWPSSREGNREGWGGGSPEGRSGVQRAAASPWHRADQLHRGDQLHQESLWGQQGQGSHVHQRGPGGGVTDTVRVSGLGLFPRAQPLPPPREVGGSEGHCWRREGQGEAECGERSLWPQPGTHGLGSACVCGVRCKWGDSTSEKGSKGQGPQVGLQPPGEVTLGPATPSAPGKPRLPGPPCGRRGGQWAQAWGAHWAGTGLTLGTENGALTRSPGGPGRPAGPGSPRAPRFPSSPAGPGGP